MSSMLDMAALSAADPSAGAMPSFDHMLGDLARQNPQLAWLTQMIAAQRQAAAAAQAELPPEDDSLRIEIDALNEELAVSQARGAKLQRIARRLADELDAAQALLSDLAAALGACGLCWGEDTRCLSCRGRGKPGRFAPDPELRLRFAGDTPLPPQSVQPVDLPAASRPSTPSSGPSERS